MSMTTPSFAPAIAVWAQMRIMRTLIQQRREGKDIWRWSRGCPAAGVALVAAVLAAAFPSWPTMIALNATTLAYNWALAPYEVDNGATWEWVGSAFLLLAPLASTVSGGTFASGLVQSIPYMKLGFTCVYLFAALAKLNPHYFDFTVSSNTSFTMFVLLGFGLKSSMLPDAAWVLAFKAGLWVLEIWEFAIPLFFWVHTPTGVVLNWLFHLGVGLIAYDFSSCGMATLPLLLNLSSLESSYGFMTTSVGSRIAWVVIALMVTMNTKEKVHQSRNRKLFWTNITKLVWLVWSLLLGAGITTQITTGAHDGGAVHLGDEEPPSVLVAVVCASLAVFMIFVGLCPYIGVKTHSTFSMFSNLRVEGGTSNHYLFLMFPGLQRLAPFGLLEDVVTVTDSNHERIRFYMRRNGGPEACQGFTGMLKRLNMEHGCLVHGNSMMGGGGPGGTDENSVLPYLVPYTQLRMLVSETDERDFFVVYENRAGEKCRFELKGGKLVAGSDSFLRVPLPVPLNKFLFFRAIQLDDKRGLCYH